MEKNTKTEVLRKNTYKMIKMRNNLIIPNALTDALFIGTEDEAFEALKNPDNVKDAGVRMPEQFLYFCHFPRKDEIFSQMSQHFTPHQRDYTFVKLPFIEYKPKHFVEMIKAGINPDTHYGDATALKVAIACGNIECFKILKENGAAVTKTIITLQRGKTSCGSPIIEELSPMTYAYYKSKDSMIELVKAAYLEEGKQPDDPFFKEAKASADKLTAEDQETCERIDADYKDALAKFLIYCGCFLTISSMALLTTCHNENDFSKETQPKAMLKHDAANQLVVQPQPVLKVDTTAQKSKTPVQEPGHIIKHADGSKMHQSAQGAHLQRN